MKRYSIVVVVLSLVLNLPSTASELEEIYQLEWQYRLEQSPLFALSLGIRPEKIAFADISPATLQAQQHFYQTIADKLENLEIEDLTEDERVNYQIFKDQIDNTLAYYQFGMFQMPFNSDSGFYSAFARAQHNFTFNDTQAYEDYLSYLSSWETHVEQQIYHMKAGLIRGFSQPAMILDSLAERVKSYIATDISKSVFYQPLQQFPEHFTVEEKQRLTAKAKNVIATIVQPGYARLSDFFADEYVPAAKKSIAATELPNGSDFYQNQIKHYTTLDLTADEIHEIGLQEVARIRAEMHDVIKSTDFNGTFSEFINFLRTDPRFYANTEEQLLERASRIAKRADAQLPRFFKHLPRTPYGVEPVPKELAPNYTTGRYVSAPKDGTRAGYYWVNTYALDKRPLYELEALTLHEAVPGHHLQIALNQELENLPPFRQHSYLSAFGEGWGLYSEWLGLEAGFYQDPYSNFGRLTYEMWRAVRLVVDTGMHAKGWSREQARQYLAENTALSLHNVNTEIDRYISWPAQALSYKLGEITIKRLRAKAEETLGKAFDIRDFHHEVLRNGSIPLNVLEQNINNYISQTLKELQSLNQSTSD